MPGIKIERLSSDNLERQEWEFNISFSFHNEIKLWVSKYVEQERKTTRHKFRDKFKRIYDGNRTNDFLTMKRKNIPIFDDVIREVKDKFKSMIDNTEIL